jgi:16S rRNA (guanine(527)-N(7))-methyltransferase RsmG
MTQSTTEFRAALETALAEFGIEELSASQLEQLNKHYSMMCRWNRHLNLTRITELVEAARRHYAESLWGGRFIGDARSMLDIGSGAGFPAVPLAVLRADILVTAIEVNQKKALFLNEVRDALGLANFQVVNGRIEDLDWTSQDLLTSRALDRAEEILTEVAIQLRAPQRLMLYCASALADRVNGHLAQGYKEERHAIPQSEARLVALYSPR